MTCVRAGCPFIVLGQMWSGTREMRLTNGMAGFQSLPFLTNQKIISVIFWLVHIIQSDSCVNSQSNLIGAESCDLIGRKSLIFIGCWESILIGKWGRADSAMIGFCRVWSCVTWLGTMECFQNEALVAHVLGFGGLVQYGKECGTFV